MLYVIAGEGTGNNTEITKALADLRDKALKDGAEFWFIIEGKDSPTKTDNAILKWFGEQETYFEVITATGTTYEGATETHASEDVFDDMVAKLVEYQGTEEVALLALPVDPEGEDEADEPVLTLIEKVADIPIDVFLLNGRMVKVELEDDEDENENTDEVPAAVVGGAKKAAAKKAAAPAKKAAKKTAAPVSEEVPEAVAAEDDEDDEDGPVVYTREELTGMTITELTGLAKGQGIDVKSGNKKDLVVALLAELGDPDAVETKPTGPVKRGAKKAPAAAATNGHATNGEVPAGFSLVVVHVGGSNRVIHAMLPTTLAMAAVVQPD